jgi:hypothetical protein
MEMAHLRGRAVAQSSSAWLWRVMQGSKEVENDGAGQSCNQPGAIPRTFGGGGEAPQQSGRGDKSNHHVVHDDAYKCAQGLKVCCCVVIQKGKGKTKTLSVATIPRTKLPHILLKPDYASVPWAASVSTLQENPEDAEDVFRRRP